MEQSELLHILLSQWLTMIKDSTKELPLYVNISTKPGF